MSSNWYCAARHVVAGIVSGYSTHWSSGAEHWRETCLSVSWHSPVDSVRRSPPFASVSRRFVLYSVWSLGQLLPKGTARSHDVIVPHLVRRRLMKPNPTPERHRQGESSLERDFFPS